MGGVQKSLTDKRDLDILWAIVTNESKVDGVIEFEIEMFWDYEKDDYGLGGDFRDGDLLVDSMNIFWFLRNNVWYNRPEWMNGNIWYASDGGYDVIDKVFQEAGSVWHITNIDEIFDPQEGL